MSTRCTTAACATPEARNSAAIAIRRGAGRMAPEDSRARVFTPVTATSGGQMLDRGGAAQPVGQPLPQRKAVAAHGRILAVAHAGVEERVHRSEERRVRKECVRTCRDR